MEEEDTRVHWLLINNCGLREKKNRKSQQDGRSLMVGICECYYYYRVVFHDGENFQP